MLRKMNYLRFLTMVIVFVTLFVSFTAVAETAIPTYDETFSIRNDISFGMTKTAVANKELEQGNRESKLYSGVQIAHRTAELEKNTSLVDKNKYIVGTTVAGQNGLAIYTFDSSEKMDSLRYLVQSSLNSIPLTETFISKYGAPLFIGEFAPFESKALNYYQLCANLKKGAKLTEYAGWLVEYQDICVLIEAVQFVEFSEGYYYENITYTPISAELYLAYQNSLVQAQQSIANDI